jgi:2-octaprenyl-6-methoxyphenol hydroxylase
MQHGQSRGAGHIPGMAYDHDVLIVGGGLNGPALALALAQAGLGVAVIDAQPVRRRAGENFDGRAYALALASKRLLDGIGVWPGVAGEAQAIAAVKTGDGLPGEGVLPWVLHFPSAELEEGPSGFMVEDRHLHAALLAAMERVAGLTLIPGTKVVAQETGGALARVSLDDGRMLTGRVLVGADGRGSGTAARAGIARAGLDYGQVALVAAIGHEKPHGGVAHQIFLPSGPLAVLPLTGNRSSIVWSEETAAARAIEALPDDAFLEVLRPRFGDFLGRIELLGGRYSYPLSLSLAERYAGQRLALVGDAAHGVHPIAGQGLNLGFRDVGAIAEVIVEAARRGEDIGAADVLARYQRWRRFDATAMALGMDGVNRLFATANPALRAARVAGMAAVNALPGLRRAFMREAAGLSGQVPRLLAGRGL